MLDNVPLASPTFIIALALIVVGYLTDDLSMFQAFIAGGAAGAGTGLIGFARNGAGRGLKK